MDMIATIIRSRFRSLLVRDFKTNDEVLILSDNARNFPSGTCVRIKFDGKMSHSVPPQIIAASIWEIECPG